VSLIDTMYQGGKLPTTTDSAKVRQIHDYFAVRLSEEMQKQHVWLAACTVAVTAGMWRGNRFRKRRRKLLELINKCRTFLGLATVEFERGWENVNIIDGYGAHSEWANRTGMSTEASVLLGGMILGPNRVNDGGGFEHPAKVEIAEAMAQDFFNIK